ncbi:DUF2937 family protein [Aliirhizobium terrae]|nr:DUF2937 family protein [Rhizobium sp. CC-CFT758]WJH41294.1 DUF2937 family protein [Rhizobium sp. CC-CFT758]
MRLFRRVLILLVAIAGAVVFSQAPELTQQYRQRLGGAIDELTTIIQNFDEQANHAGLERQAALNIYAVSPEQFLRSQGDSMRHTFDRYESLSDQMLHLASTSPILRPLVVARNPDPATLANAWRDFVPGVPVSIAGLVWAVLGAVVGLMVAVILLVVFRATAMIGGRSRGRAAPMTTSRAERQVFSEPYPKARH